MTFEEYVEDHATYRLNLSKPNELLMKFSPLDGIMVTTTEDASADLPDVVVPGCFCVICSRPLGNMADMMSHWEEKHK